ncbi:hypothetical protein FB45DRAFT_896185 [Roridomyces roridus]|uniref:Uncharacterized protein n=1 Tax=Roridomyces roridus TaxID=1738132 RepID=A0AAD7FY39_9AGAR|nr:hypothetical protein FB45DRAFT_896185 [Roridomyces roridus]
MSRPQPATAANPEYGDAAVIRSPSPASSVGSVYPPDQTSFSDSETMLDKRAFERKMDVKLDLRRAMKEEEEADVDPLLPRPETFVEERIVSEKILRNLRNRVAELEENELFEQTMLRGSQAGLEEYDIPQDIDKLMRGMMGLSTLATNANANAAKIADGPWNQPSLGGSAIAPQKRPKGKGKSRK